MRAAAYLFQEISKGVDGFGAKTCAIALWNAVEGKRLLRGGLGSAVALGMIAV